MHELKLTIADRSRGPKPTEYKKRTSLTQLMIAIEENQKNTQLGARKIVLRN